MKTMSVIVFLKMFSPPLLVLGQKLATSDNRAEPTKLGPFSILINFFILMTSLKKLIQKRNFSLPPLVLGQKLVTSDNELLH